jgi:DNA-directed RNA polymerase specialized sigma24 family protein
MDQVLESWLALEAKTDSEEKLGDLLTSHAMPVITKVVSRRIGRPHDADDVSSEVLLQLMVRLRDGRARGELKGIEGFTNYVAAAAHHGCDHYLRRKHPLRWRLRNRIRYVLEHDPRFALWKSADGSWLCGRAEWRGRAAGPPLPSADRLSAVTTRSPRELLWHVFELTGAPLELPAVVDLAALVWHVPQVPRDAGEALDAFPDPRPGIDVALQQRRRAEHVWREIRELPVRQRQALLLNLRDDAIALFLVTGTASLRAIAECIDMSAEGLASLWNELPLSDNAIAVRLGSTRQQVINLRMAARKRLVNRLSGRS